MQVHAPTKVASEENKDAFRSQLLAALNEITSYDIKGLIGDLNAKVNGDRRASRPQWDRMGLQAPPLHRFQESSRQHPRNHCGIFASYTVYCNYCAATPPVK